MWRFIMCEDSKKSSLRDTAVRIAVAEWFYIQTEAINTKAWGITSWSYRQNYWWKNYTQISDYANTNSCIRVTGKWKSLFVLHVNWHTFYNLKDAFRKTDSSQALIWLLTKTDLFPIHKTIVWFSQWIRWPCVNCMLISHLRLFLECKRKSNDISVMW